MGKARTLIPYLQEIATFILTATVLMGYSLEGAWWAKLSLTNCLALERSYIDVNVWHQAIMAALFIVICYFASLIRCQGQRMLLIWLVIYCSLLYLSPVIYHLDKLETESITTLMTALVTGLLAAMIAGSAKRLLMVVVTLSTTQAVYAMLDEITLKSGILSGTVYRIGGTFGHPGRLYIEMLLSLPLVVVLTVSTPYKTARFFGIACVLLLLATLFLTYYRSGMFALLITSPWLAWRLGVKTRLVIFTTAICLSAFILVWGIRTIGMSNERSTYRSTNGHFLLMRDGLLNFQQHWLTGNGPGRLHHLIVDQPIDRTIPVYYTEPKSLPIEWLDEFGIVGAGLYFFLILSLLESVKSAYYRDTSKNSAYGNVTDCVSPTKLINVLDFSMSSHKRFTDCTIILGITAAWLALITIGLFDTPFGISDCAAPTAIATSLLGALLLPRKNGDSYNVPKNLYR